MPGVIMENGSRNGSHTNHDRDVRPNGINGGVHTSEKTQEKSKPKAEPQQNMTPTSPFAPTGLNGNFTTDALRQEGEGKTIAREAEDRSFQLPPEINHITQGYIGLKDLLSRMAQKTHSDLIGTITELSQMPLPASATNGNTSHSNAPDDNSLENVNKKVRLLQFLETAHDSWTKALVIAGWSRRAEEVSKIIDLHVHLNLQKQLYLNILGRMGDDKKELMAARMLNPDLRTALEVLTTGKASWMPDLGYLQPPPLTAKEILQNLEKLNTLLSIRLNLHDYDTIPIHFKEYTIQSGRATFKVAGEYEVDITIADEDPETQFWFIDLRFLFRPSTASLSELVKGHIESKVNGVLLKDGLTGCYQYLHELVLTYKIGEYKRQGIALARGKWTDTIAIEPLNRAISIQYWRNKHGMPSQTRSWFIMGVGSPRRKTAGPKSKATSHLFIRWFRDAKEVENVEIPFDTINISAEALLKSVIARHVAYILESTHDKLRQNPLFSKRELGLSSHISLTEPAESFLKVQLTNDHTITVQIEPITGRFVFSPASPPVTIWENNLNRGCIDLAENAHTYIEKLRYALIDQAVSSCGITVGWIRTGSPVRRSETLRDALKNAVPKDYSAMMWFTRSEWSKEWYLTVFPSMSGERWLLIRIASAPNVMEKPSVPRNGTNVRNIVDPKITSFIPLPIGTASPDLSYAFMSALNIFAAGVISHHANLQALHVRRCAYMLRQGNPARAITLPSIYVRVEDILPSKNKPKRTGRGWVRNVMRLNFQGIETIMQSPSALAQGSNGDLTQSSQSQPSQTMVSGSQQLGSQNLTTTPRRNENSFVVIEARMVLPAAKSIESINERVDRDIAFNSRTGSFAFRLRCKVGEAVIDKLVEVAVRVERLVEFSKVLQKHAESKSLTIDMVSLGRITFTYGHVPVPTNEHSMNVDHQTRTYKATIDFGAVENTMALILEKGNPHIRIIDHLTKVLNSTEGLNGVATLLTQTLPVNRGLDSIERNWPLSVQPESNEMFVNVRAADWYIIRYGIRQLSLQGSKNQPTLRNFVFAVRLRQRRGKPWWFVQRTDNLINGRAKEADALDGALKPLWNSSGTGWQGKSTSGVAEASGIYELLERLNEVMQNFATANGTDNGSGAAQVPVISQPSVLAPVQALPQKQNPTSFQRQQHQQHQQRQQLHTPNQSQNHGQGRNHPVKQEVVEID